MRGASTGSPHAGSARRRMQAAVRRARPPAPYGPRLSPVCLLHALDHEGVGGAPNVGHHQVDLLAHGHRPAVPGPPIQSDGILPVDDAGGLSKDAVGQQRGGVETSPRSRCACGALQADAQAIVARLCSTAASPAHHPGASRTPLMSVSKGPMLSGSLAMSVKTGALCTTSVCRGQGQVHSIFSIELDPNTVSGRHG
jgi:hypothetical protein